MVNKVNILNIYCRSSRDPDWQVTPSLP